MPVTTVRATIDTAFQKGNCLDFITTIMAGHVATAMLCDNGIRRRGYHVHGRQTRRRLSGDVKPSAEIFGVVRSKPGRTKRLMYRRDHGRAMAGIYQQIPSFGFVAAEDGVALRVKKTFQSHDQ